MPSRGYLQRRRNELQDRCNGFQEQSNLLGKLILRLRKDSVGKNATDKFRLENEIKEAETERTEIWREIEKLEEEIEKIDNQLASFDSSSVNMRESPEEIDDQEVPPISPPIRAWSQWAAQEKPTPAQLVECAARLCEILAADHARGTWHQTLTLASVMVDIEEGTPSIQAGNQIPAGDDAASERAADLRSISFLLYEALVGRPPVADRAERAAALAKVKGLSLSLIRLLLRATDELPDWPNDDPASWAKLLRATQSGYLLADQLARRGPRPVGEALKLVIEISDLLHRWRADGLNYVSPASELILLEEEMDGTPNSQ